jgi:predicted TIM-barrel fold metal-dependent hydrolase
MPEDLSESGMAEWRAGMALLAKEPNVVAKLSGLGTFIHRNDPAHIAGICKETIALFGPSRCLYGSNFPIEKIWTDYPPLIGAFRAALGDYSPAEQADMFCNVAARVYRLG